MFSFEWVHSANKAVDRGLKNTGCVSSCSMIWGDWFSLQGL